MNLYDAKRPCEKCGFDRMTTKFCLRGEGCAKHYDFFPSRFRHIDDRMHRACPNCGATVDELPMNYKPVKSIGLQ